MTEQTTTTPAPTESYTPAHLSARAFGPPVTRGRVVLYTDHAGEEFAAIVTSVHSENVVNLVVFADRRLDRGYGVIVPAGTVWFGSMIAFDYDRGPGTWRWAEQV